MNHGAIVVFAIIALLLPPFVTIMTRNLLTDQPRFSGEERARRGP
jgi:hypothetical protein